MEKYGDKIGAYILDKETGEARIAETREEWGEFMERPDSRRLASDKFDGLHVSTVFLGIDYFGGKESPILWETMIFGSEKRELSGFQERYRTREEALEGHARAVLFAKENI